MELYFNDKSFSLNNTLLYESFVVNEEEQLSNDSDIKKSIDIVSNDKNKLKELLKFINGESNNEGQIDFSKIIVNLEKLNNVISQFNLNLK